MALHQGQLAGGFSFRRLGRAQKIVDRLGGEPYLLLGLPPRPKGMQVKTYEMPARELQPIERSLRLEAANRFGPCYYSTPSGRLRMSFLEQACFHFVHHS